MIKKICNLILAKSSYYEWSSSLFLPLPVDDHLKKKNIPHFSLQKDQELESQLDDILFIIVVPKLAKTLSPPTPSLLVRK